MHTGKTTIAFRLDDAIHAVVFSRNGAMIGATSVRGDLKVWDLAERNERYSDLQNGAYNAIAFSPGGETFVSSGNDDVRVVNLNTGESKKLSVTKVGTLAFSPNGELLATGGSDRTIRLWRMADTIAVRELKGHFGTVMSLAFHPQGGMLASGSTDHTVLLWNLDEAGSASSVDTLNLDTSNISIALSPNGKSVAVSGSYEPGTVITDAASDSVRVWECATLKEEKILRGQPGIISLAASAEGVIAAGGGQGNLALWDMDGGMLKREFSTGSMGVTALEFSPDGTKIAVGKADGELSVWGTRGDAIWTMEHAHAGIINSVAFNPDGKSLASVGWDGVARLWNVADGKLSSPFTIGFGCGNVRVAFAPPHGQILAVSSQFLGIRLWNLERPQETPREIQAPTIAIVFSPDGALLFSGGNDGLIKIWDAVTLDQRCTLKGHKTAVVGLAMSGDGRTLVSCSWDKTLRFWRAASEQDVRAAGQWAD